MLTTLLVLTSLLFCGGFVTAYRQNKMSLVPSFMFSLLMLSIAANKDKICPFSVIRKFEAELISYVDTELLLIFLKNIAQNYVGAWTKLTDGRHAEIMVIEPASIARPVVRLENGEVIALNGTGIEISHII